MWPAAFSLLMISGVCALGILAALFVRRLGLRLYVAPILMACYFVGMTIGAKALYDLRKPGQPRLFSWGRIATASPVGKVVWPARHVHAGGSRERLLHG